MNLNNISFPYPVLGISDDITPILPIDTVSVELVNDTRNYSFTINLKFENSEIVNLINTNKAEFSCEYDCVKTMLRRCKKSNIPKFEIVIPKNSINGRINFNCFVSVKEPIYDYSNKGFHDDYQGFLFNLSPGDILITFPQFHYDADIKYDKLQAAGSFMQIREDNKINEVFFDITKNKIEIIMPTVLYKLYCNPAVKGSAEIIHSSLVLNALTYALMNIKENEQTTWAKTIYYRLKNEGNFSIDELNNVAVIPSIAQRLLKDPYSRLFNKIMSNQNTIED